MSGERYCVNCGDDLGREYDPGILCDACWTMAQMKPMFDTLTRERDEARKAAEQAHAELAALRDKVKPAGRAALLTPEEITLIRQRLRELVLSGQDGSDLVSGRLAFGCAMQLIAEVDTIQHFRDAAVLRDLHREPERLRAELAAARRTIDDREQTIARRVEQADAIARERNLALVEVERLRAVIAEPTGEELGRMARLVDRCLMGAGGGYKWVVREILADQRRRAGGEP